MRASATNVEIARVLGVQHTTVSRWRSGDRVPNRSMMIHIFNRFSFKTDDQLTAAEDGTYAAKFEAALIASGVRAEDDSATNP
jgi:transcriptional regulator with XRE-family HTH domain